MTNTSVPYLPLLLLLLLLRVFCLGQGWVEAGSTSIPSSSLLGDDAHQVSRASAAPIQASLPEDATVNDPRSSAAEVYLLADILRGMAAEAVRNVTVSNPPPRHRHKDTLGGAQITSFTAKFLSKILSKTASTATISPWEATALEQQCSADGDSTRLRDRSLCPWFYRVNEVKDGTRIPRVMMEAQCNCTLSTGCQNTATVNWTPSCRPIMSRVPVIRCTPLGDACWSDVEDLAVGCGCVYGLINTYSN